LGLKTFYNNVRHKIREIRSGFPYVFPDGIVDFIRSITSATNDNDIVITPATALRISTFFTCVLVRAESLASLPASVKQYTSEGSRTAYNHPAHYLIHNRPNPFQTASDFWETVSAHIDTQGEAIGIISFSGRWMPTAINLVPCPQDVQVKVYHGRPYYEYNGVVYEDWQVLHFKDLSLDGIRGCSKVRYNAETLGYAAKLKSYGKKAIGSKPPGYFSTDAPYETVKTQQDNIAKAWREKIAAGDPPTVPFGLKYNSLMINPEDAQYLEVIGATKEDIYGFCRVPPTLAQNYLRATFANAEQQDLVFIKYTMLPLITKIEQECNSKLFSEANKTASEPYYIKFNVSAFMRGDFKSRSEGYARLFNIGAIDGDTIAELEDWNKWEGGNQRFVQMNMMPLNRVNDVIDALTKGEQPEAVKDDQQRTIGYKLNNGFYMPLNSSQPHGE
jgi:HK97 family phage portal protein